MTLIIAAGLLLANLAIYAQTYGFKYLVFDDDVGLFQNPMVRAGLTASGVRWAFTTVHLGNWIPVTWLSHMLDFELLGAEPGRHHLVNVAIHVTTTLLLFALFSRLTGRAGAAAAIAALFSLHPLRVESVAWIIERKDVLSALLWVVTLWLYVWYVEKESSWGRYLAVVGAFTVGLLVKPMLVTLPFVLLLLDYWPLGRLRIPPSGAPFPPPSSLGPLVREKAPLFVISAVSSFVTAMAQQRGGAVRTFDQVPLGDRIANAILAYATYIRRTVWPSRLAVYYPYELHLPVWKVALAGLLLAAVTVVCLATIRAHPCFFVGWFWYLGTLVPVIGLVQVGAMATADRYTYIPSIGLLLMVVMLPLDLATALSARRAPPAGWPPLRPALGVLALAAAAVLTALSWNQTRHWRDSVALFEHTLAVTRENALAHYNLATALAQQGRIDEAMTHYRETLRLGPQFADANANLGLALFGQGKTEEAIAHYEAELRRDPAHPEALCHLGVALATQGRLVEALARFEEALRARPDYVDAHYNRGLALEKLGRRPEAVVAYARALHLAPDNADAEYNLARTLADLGRLSDAVAHLERLLRIRPDYPHAREDLEALRRRQSTSGA